MVDINRLTRRRVIPSKKFAIKTTELLNFGVEGSPSVIMINKGTVSNESASSSAKRLKEHARKSPWTDDKINQAFADDQLKKKRKLDSVEELQDFVAALSKG